VSAPGYGTSVSTEEIAMKPTTGGRETVQPDVVREALRTATDIVCAAEPELAGHLNPRLQQTLKIDYDIIHNMTSLTNRIVSYLQPPLPKR
jgi:hypothetical protein